jgi:hypothetical protein
MRIVARTAGIPWSASLLRLLLEELYVEDELIRMLGPAEMLKPAAYPQALAVALALRHSWRPDDLQRLVRRLHLTRSGVKGLTDRRRCVDRL